MDLSFAMQTLAMLYVLENHASLGKHVTTLPDELNTRVASLKLQAMKIGFDKLSDEQVAYLHQA